MMYDEPPLSPRQQGKRARLEGKPILTNPYPDPLHSPEGQEWDDGYMQEETTLRNPLY